METTITVKQVLGKDLKEGDEVWVNNSFEKVISPYHYNNCKLRIGDEVFIKHEEDVFLVRVPSPEIKLPTEHNPCENEGERIVYSSGFNTAIREIKRLNNI